MPVRDNKTLTITVAGKDPLPEASSFSRVIHDTIVVLTEIGAGLSKKDSRPVVWRISHVSMNTPISVDLLADKKPLGARTVAIYLKGLVDLEKKPMMPRHYSDRALAGVKRIANALANGVASVEFAAPGEMPLSPTLRVVANIDAIYKNRPDSLYQLSSIEGRLELISMHGGFAAQIFNIRTGEKVTCTLDKELMDEAAKFFGKRVSMYGRVRYTREGTPVEIEVKVVRAMKDRAVLPQFADLEGIDITAGMDPTEYIGRLRDAN